MERYIVEVIVFQAIFLAVYWILFRKGTFFKVNRAYLLAAPLLAMVLPFINISVFQTIAPETVRAVFLPEIFIGSEVPKIEGSATETFAFKENLLWIYYTGVILSLLFFAIKVRRLLSFLKWRKGSEKIIKVPKSTEAFTFLNYICIGEEVDTLSRKHILAHEHIHVRQKHTWDLLIFEALRIVLWFNPLVYLYQREIARVHEYLADAHASNHTTEKEYYEKLLNTAFGTSNLSFTNTFFNHSSIKNRIIMLQKSKSKKSNLLKYALILPLIFGMLFYVSCTDDTKLEDEISLEEQIAQLQFAIEDKENLTTEELTKLQALVKKVDEKDTTTKINYEYTADQNAEKSETVVKVERLGNDQDEISFSMIQEVPVMKDCQDLATNELRKKCMSDHIDKHIASNFDTELGTKLGLSGLQRIYALFKIDKNGNIIDVKARAPHPKLKEETERVVNAIPSFEKGGMHNGKPVTTSYVKAIVFKIED